MSLPAGHAMSYRQAKLARATTRGGNMAVPGILRNRWVGLGFAAMLAAGSAALGSAAGAAPAEGTILQAGGATAVEGSYLVVLKDSVSTGAIDTEANTLASKHSGAVGH